MRGIQLLDLDPSKKVYSLHFFAICIKKLSLILNLNLKIYAIWKKPLSQNIRNLNFIFNHPYLNVKYFYKDLNKTKICFYLKAGSAPLKILQLLHYVLVARHDNWPHEGAERGVALNSLPGNHRPLFLAVTDAPDNLELVRALGVPQYQLVVGRAFVANERRTFFSAPRVIRTAIVWKFKYLYTSLFF